MELNSMKCLAEGCNGSATNGNYCIFHAKGFGKPRPGIKSVRLSVFSRNDAPFEIVAYAIRARQEVGSRVAIKVWTSPKGNKVNIKGGPANERIFKIKKDQLKEAVKEFEEKKVEKYFWDGRKR